MSSVKRIVLDTNFLMMPGQLKVDIFAEFGKLDYPYSLWICRTTLDELASIMEKDKNKDRIAAKIARELIAVKRIGIIDTALPVDEALVKLSAEPDVVIATQDKALRKRIKGKKLVVRQKKYIALVN